MSTFLDVECVGDNVILRNFIRVLGVDPQVLMQYF